MGRCHMSREFEVFRLIILHCFPENEIVIGSMHRGKAPTSRRASQTMLPMETEGYARRGALFSTVWEMLMTFLSERHAVRFPTDDYHKNSIPDMSHRLSAGLCFAQ